MWYVIGKNLVDEHFKVGLDPKKKKKKNPLASLDATDNKDNICRKLMYV